MSFPNITKLFIKKIFHNEYKDFFRIEISTFVGVVYNDKSLNTSADLDKFIAGIKFALPFTVIEVIEEKQNEEKTDEIIPIPEQKKMIYHFNSGEK